MAITTSPDNIPSPTSGDPYNYVVDMAAIADGTQDALTQKANMGVGTSTQRTAALGGFPDGALWFDTTLSTTWRRIAGAWVPTPGNNYGVGTTTQRTAALGGFPDGALWYDTTTSSEWRRVAGAWVDLDTDIALSITSGAPFADPRAYRTGGMAQLQGGVFLSGIAASTWVSCAALPLGWRPKEYQYYPVIIPNSNAQGGLRIQENGDVEIYTDTTSSSVVTLTGANFRIA